MTPPADINPRIIEALYSEGLVLSDEVRAMFSFSDGAMGDPEDEARIALSCEALRTTTRMMHSLAWLLNQRAYLRGEISEFQLRRHGKLQTDFPAADPARLGLLAPEVRELVETTERFHARLARLDCDWRQSHREAPSVFERLRQRFAGLAH